MNDIYDHAPECDVAIWLERAIETDAPRWLGVPDDVACQCQKLRACEQRVEARTMDVVGPHNYKQGVKDGYAAGVKAAREAVWQSAGPGADAFSQMVFDRAIAAIDGLKGEQA